MGLSFFFGNKGVTQPREPLHLSQVTIEGRFLSQHHINEKRAREGLLFRLYGAEERNRTLDRLITSQMLYQLSYLSTYFVYFASDFRQTSFVILAPCLRLSCRILT